MSLLSLLQQGGIALIPLGICSVLVIAVILERIAAYLRIGRLPRESMRRVENLVSEGEWHEAVRLLDDLDNPYARIAKASLMRGDASKEELSDILTLACDVEIADATRNLPILSTIGNIALFIGLFGTVIGIMEAFYQMKQLGQTGFDVVAGGVSQALIATALGLAIGIIAVIANNWCNAWVEKYRLGLERFATEWVYRLHHLRTKAPEEKEQVV